ncbi:unnamed protein product [Calypogeia fissa]
MFPSRRNVFNPVGAHLSVKSRFQRCDQFNRSATDYHGLVYPIPRTVQTDHAHISQKRPANSPSIAIEEV